jgi:hypothetical protein
VLDKAGEVGGMYTTGFDCQHVLSFPICTSLQKTRCYHPKQSNPYVAAYLTAWKQINEKQMFHQLFMESCQSDFKDCIPANNKRNVSNTLICPFNYFSKYLVDHLLCFAEDL